MRLHSGERLLRLLQLGGGDELRRAAGRDDGGAVGGLDDHLEVRRVRGAGDILQGERVNVALVGDQVEIGADACFGRMDETEVAHDIDDPEILVAGRRLHDLFGGRYFE